MQVCGGYDETGIKASYSDDGYLRSKSFPVIARDEAIFVCGVKVLQIAALPLAMTHLCCISAYV